MATRRSSSTPTARRRRAEAPSSSTPPCNGSSPLVVGAPARGVQQNPAVDAEIRYARSGGVAIAYQVVGEGEVDLVYVPDYVSNLVYDWEYPRRREFYERLARSF